MPGRPPALTPEVQERIRNALSVGNTRADSAAYAGVGRSTLFAWLARGRRQKRGRYRDFLDACKKAEAEAAVACVVRIRKAAEDGTWQAAAWWLERRRYEDWALKDKGKLAELAAAVKQLEAEVRALRTDQAGAAGAAPAEHFRRRA